MKYIFVTMIGILFCVSDLIAQNRLDYFISQAVKNSPLINENNSLNKVNELEAKRLKAIYTKGPNRDHSKLSFAPIIATDNNKNRF